MTYPLSNGAMHALPKPAGATTEPSLQILTTTGHDTLIYGRKDLFTLRAAITTALKKEPAAPVTQESVADWIATQPVFARAAYEYVISEGSPEEVEELINSFREDTEQTADKSVQPNHAEALDVDAITQAIYSSDCRFSLPSARMLAESVVDRYQASKKGGAK